jgi:hypothetical protein
VSHTMCGMEVMVSNDVVDPRLDERKHSPRCMLAIKSNNLADPSLSEDSCVAAFKD